MSSRETMTTQEVIDLLLEKGITKEQFLDVITKQNIRPVGEDGKKLTLEEIKRELEEWDDNPVFH